ncbi:transposase [Spartinivicinus marinus]|uniref:transposase n=1 Tax=Spartinivicinus marinus TaxID=2994442 RepID=UPI00210819F6|nr:transposase [Spartinivicinus marinus]MCX4029617.1 transposase [Spartinivicinus marinus]
MTKARQEKVSLADTPYYHCVMRCVRRAFLCGEDRVTGLSYEHRKSWIVDRIAVLSEVFAIDVCAYAVMSNHFHVVVRVDADSALQWSDKTVAKRWCSLFKGNLLVSRWLSTKTKPLHEAELKVVKEIVAEWRERLMNISWFIPLGHKCVA